MPKNSSSNTNGGIGFPGLLTLVFIVLRLIPSGTYGHHIIDWSWWWVLSPMWISFGIVLVFMLIVLLVTLLKDR